MPNRFRSPSEAVIICTRNRPRELEETLRSVAAQSGAEERPVLIVDGSDPEDADATARVVESTADELPFRYLRYSGPPAGTRQRNSGVDHLPQSVEIAHFIDDDVALQADYFCTLSEALTQHPELLGVGGVIVDSKTATPSFPNTTAAHILFLLRTDTPSRVLPSGQTTPAWPISDQVLQPAEWLSTCASSYRREVFEHHRFDPSIEGPSPRLEDLDFSYRVAQDGPLAVASGARCVHRTASTNRHAPEEASHMRVVRRYWFVEKNLGSALNRISFWWSMLGKFFALLVSTTPDRDEALRGFLRGVRTVLHGDHDLLRSG